MKSFLLIAFLVSSGMLISFNVDSSKRLKQVGDPPVTYETHIKQIISEKCSPCHIPSKGGNKESFETYRDVKSSLREIIERIERHPGQRGFMPLVRQERGFMPILETRLPDSLINLFRQWKTDSLLER